MPAVNVNIQPEIIRWALSQTQKEKLGDTLMNNIIQWLNGTKTPTFKQIEDFSKKANIPLGYFFLQTPPVEQMELLEYRTVDSIQPFSYTHLNVFFNAFCDNIYKREKGGNYG